MTESSDARPSRWRGLLTPTRERVEVVALSLVLILCGAVVFAVVPAVAGDQKLVGEPVPAGDVPAIVATALSCPSLNPPRLAAQLMAASGFSEAGANGNIAGLDPAAWSKWRPSSTARVTDRAAVIAALGHRTCDTVGRLRAGGLSDDLWPAAVAAEQAGVEAVIAAKGVPAGQKKHVDTVVAYSRWYADQPEFEIGAPAAETPPVAAPPVPVPVDLVAYVNAAGRICPAITPARVAAQLQALSGFDTNLRSADGRVGVAQFTPQLWATYQSRKDASMWDPEEAIPAMGLAMCRLDTELAGLGGDPYVLALGAYQWGPNVVRQAGGLPRTTVAQLADRAVAQMPAYEKDKRLVVTAPKPVVTSKPPVKPSASTSTPTTTAPTTAPATPTAKPLYEPGKVYQFVNVHAGGSVLEVPNLDASKPSGTLVNLHQDNGGPNQKWRLDKVGDFVTLTNVHYNLALSIENGSKDDAGKLVVETPDPAATRQQWKLIEVGGKEITLFNRNSEKVADIAGNDFGAPFADGTWNSANVQQWSYQDYARDQRWNLR